MKHKTYWNPHLETLTANDLNTLEAETLKRQLAYVYENSSFYRKKFADHALSADDFKSRNDLRKFPFTEKNELLATQKEAGALGDHQCAQLKDVVRIQGTSGTTGRPLFIGLTRNDINLWNELFARHAWTGGLRPEDSIINPFNFSLFAGGMSESSGAEYMGITVIPAPFASTGTEKFMQIVKTFKPSVLFCTPSMTTFLEDAVRKYLQVEPIELGFKKGFMAGEALSDDERQRIENTWGITARNYYGLSDVAADIAAECGQSEGLHFCGQGALVAELINPNTSESLPMKDGSEGEIVFTTVNREATPVIRYRVKDMVKIYTRPCPCGRTGFRFRIIGRSDDMIKIKGVNVFPSAVKGIIQRFAPDTTGEFRIVLPHPGPSFGINLTLKVEYGEHVQKAHLAAIEKRIATEIRNTLVFTPEIDWAAPGTLARSQYKTEYFEHAYTDDPGNESIE
jgi:phenylacetate-CoA ligase